MIDLAPEQLAEVRKILSETVPEYRAVAYGSRVRGTNRRFSDLDLAVEGKEINYTNRAEQLAAQSKPLHAQFLAKLDALLPPAEVEEIKDLMTYNKVKVTYDAYSQMVPGLTEAEKAKILEWLKAAREEAIDGGNAPEKSSIFHKYKDLINHYLDAQGHNTAQAIKDWVAAHPNTNNPVTK